MDSQGFVVCFGIGCLTLLAAVMFICGAINERKK